MTQVFIGIFSLLTLLYSVSISQQADLGVLPLQHLGPLNMSPVLGPRMQQKLLLPLNMVFNLKPHLFFFPLKLRGILRGVLQLPLEIREVVVVVLVVVVVVVLVGFSRQLKTDLGGPKPSWLGTCLPAYMKLWGQKFLHLSIESNKCLP